jgi:hypothetical protein
MIARLSRAAPATYIDDVRIGWPGPTGQKQEESFAWRASPE